MRANPGTSRRSLWFRVRDFVVPGMTSEAYKFLNLRYRVPSITPGFACDKKLQHI